MAHSGGRNDHSVLWHGWHRYLQQLDRRPIKTKALTAAGMAGASDLLAQRLASKAPINWRRTLAMALFGLVWSGPSSHWWFGFLERFFGRRRELGTVAEKVAADQLLYGPLCNILAISYISLVIDGRSLEATKQKLERDYVGIQLNAWKLWPVASVINQSGYIPVKLRPLFTNCVSFIWSTFLILRAQAITGLNPVPALKSA